ncbi:hypothetical protein DY000_02042216 [Brassica cretica]|uniref:Uncharacterized protein n=1 Tax=Brassica cretica TaxID=69181 RepID=A0ABQ7B9P3_BRACR|nr:hypothetical protein DY000_02042216 [Brassica cretica]
MNNSEQRENKLGEGKKTKGHYYPLRLNTSRFQIRNRRSRVSKTSRTGEIRIPRTLAAAVEARLPTGPRIYASSIKPVKRVFHAGGYISQRTATARKGPPSTKIKLTTIGMNPKTPMTN